MVRNRVKATPVTPAQVNMDYILDERARELYGEERRNYTLRRTGMLLSRVRKLNDQSKAAIKDYNVLWPIPQFAIDQNIKAAITQNPGYKVVIKP
jgi:hypothetical protein